MTAMTTKRKSAPRKATRKAAPAQNGVSGQEATPPEEFVKNPEGKPTESKAPAEQKLEHPYGNKMVYVFQPSNGAAPIIFPSILEVETDAYFFWKIYDLNEMFQAFEWMKKAGVPRYIQARVMQLDDTEKAEFFAGWFKTMTAPQGVSPPGES